MSAEVKPEQLFLELGDIIKINAPNNADINNHVFLIAYLDDTGIDLYDADTFQKHTIGIADGKLSDETVETIEILSKPEEKGYARQHGLLVGATISVQFGGDVPVTINGTISGLEEDQIEITTYPEDKKIYIDFGYKGIPKNLPIEHIRPFAPPVPEASPESVAALPAPPSPATERDETEEDIGEEADIGEEGVDVSVPVADIQDRLKEVLIDADQIVFGEELGTITQFVPVAEEKRRFGLETQVNDMLDELLSTIPSGGRTKSVLNGIHTMIERFKQLRAMFSHTSQQGEITGPALKGAQYKPLAERLFKLDRKLYWLLPIVRNKRKLYNIDVGRGDDASDFVSLTDASANTGIYELVQQYQRNAIPDGQNKYQYLYQHLNPYFTPFQRATDLKDIVAGKAVETNTTAVIYNLDDFYSSVVCDDTLGKQRFVIEKYNLGLSQLHSSDLKSSRLVATRVSLTPNDSMDIMGFLNLPEAFIAYSHINLPTSTILSRANLNVVPFNYWSVLNKSTNVEITEIDEGSTTAHNESGTYLDDIKASLFKQSVGYHDRVQKTTYKRFLKNMIPKTRTLFELIKRYIKTNTSYLAIIQYLEPFLIYPDDITFKQYEAILSFIGEHILNLRKDFAAQQTANQYYLNWTYRGSTSHAMTDLPDLLPGRYSKAITDGYGSQVAMSTPEFIRMIKTTDSGRLYTSAASLTDFDLFQPVNVEQIIKDNLAETVYDKKVAEENNTCKSFVLAKYYIDLDAVTDDDGNADVYFDKKYDPTRYDIASEFEPQQATMSPEAYVEFLKQHLESNVGLSPSEAVRESQALAAGKRRVVAGEYAYTLDEFDNPKYFVRDENNTWVVNAELGNMKLDGTTFCNLQKKCLQIKSSCGDLAINREKIKQQQLEDITAQFDSKFHLSIDELRTKLTRNYKHDLQNVEALQGCSYVR